MVISGNPPTLRVSVLDSLEVLPPPLPPLRPGPLRRRFAPNTVFLEVFGPKCFKRLRGVSSGGLRGGVSGGPFGSPWKKTPCFCYHGQFSRGFWAQGGFQGPFFSGVLGPRGLQGSFWVSKVPPKRVFPRGNGLERHLHTALAVFLCVFGPGGEEGAFSSRKSVQTPAPSSFARFPCPSPPP